MDLRSGAQYTFEQLDAAAFAGRSEASIPFAPAAGIDFIVAVLRAWREGRPFCATEGPQKPPPLSTLPAECAHVKLTSASTGLPRVVLFSGSQLAADAENIVGTMGLRPEWPNLGVISLAHSYGFSNLVLPLLLHGIPLHLTSALPETVRSAITRLGSVTLAGIPALWRTWHEAEALGDGVRLAISAGAPLPVELEGAIFTAAGLKVHNFYGATECGGIAYDAGHEPRTENTYVGQPLQGVAVEPMDDGCLLVRSKAVGLRYWPETDPALGQGCFKTTDLVDMVEGRVFLRGRAGDQINVAGRKVSPETIEAALRHEPRVNDCVVFGVPENETGRSERIVACIVGSDGLNREALRAAAAQSLAAWQIPREWIFLEALPVNARGKRSRADWRRRFLNGELPSGR